VNTIVLPTIWVTAALVIILSGIRDIMNMIRSLRWLESGQASCRAAEPENAPFITILLPVLREQKLIAETLDLFADLRYPHTRLHISVITTEKEIVQREQAAARLRALARDIASGRLSTSLLLERYLGVFAEDTLGQLLIQTRSMRNEEEIYQLLAKKFEQYPSTIDLVKKHVARLNKDADTQLFSHLHYPGIDGNMADQIAYAVRQLRAHPPAPSSEPAYLAVYNADSRPHLDTLTLVATMCHSYKRQYGSYPPALQQSATYLENINAMQSRWGWLLQASAFLQTRWVLSHELPRLLFQSASALRFQRGRLSFFQRLRGAEFALCVGHGFFLRSDLSDLFFTGGLSDDLLWSFRLCTGHLPILPIPLLESAESPTTLRSLLIQKRNWFLGYLEYFRCRRETLGEGKSNRLTTELVTGYGLLRALKWLLLSPVIFTAFILPIFLLSWPLFLLAWLAYAVYGFLSYGIVLWKLEDLKQFSGGAWQPGSFSRRRKAGLLVLSLPAFLLESLGPWGCLLQQIICLITHTPVYKLKTER
jgi:hypothetical protein